MEEWRPSVNSLTFLLDGFVKALGLILARDPYVWSATIVSLKVSGSAVLLASLTAIPVALAISFWEFRGKGLLVTAINTAMGLPPVAVGLAVFLFLVPAGPLGILNLIFTPAAMVVAQYILVTPIITGVGLAAIGAVSPTVRDTAYTLGGTRKDVALVVVKEARHGIATAILAGFGRAIAEVGAILIVGGNIVYADGISYTRTLTAAITVETSKGDISTSIALGIIVLALAFAANLLASIIRRRTA
ncbi:MAG: ABC transporter permease [Candidatus Hydrothermarchaeota archaeon]